MRFAPTTDPTQAITRRRFLAQAGLAPVAAGAVVAGCGETPPPPGAVERPEDDMYARLGVRTFINAAGTYTALTASLVPDDVAAAMSRAARQYVPLRELHEAAGAHIASLIGCDAALVTAGCAAALTQGTAACVCGDDQEAIRQVPDTTGLKDKVILQATHRFGYDHAIRNVGVELVEIETREELVEAIDEQTAMLFYLNAATDQGAISREEWAEVGAQTGVPTMIDAAADVPPASNLHAFTDMGFDLVAFSGGKGLRGPQCSGLLLGRPDLIAAAYLNGSPHSNSVGRLAKVGKEEIVGLTRAVELYLEKDHAAEWAEWETRVQTIVDAVSDIDGVTAAQFVPEHANAVPHAGIDWDPAVIARTRNDVAEALRAGEPSIEPQPSNGEAPRLQIGVWMMQPGDAEIVASRCAEVLRA